MEPGEVETLLLQQPGVRNAIVSVHEEQLVAYLLARETPPDNAALRAALRAQLPAVMVPSEFILLDEFPMTPSGKIKRNALPVPGGQAQTRKSTHQAARTPAESMLTEIWADLLKNPNLGIHDDFFDLGGHSLLAIQLVGRIENALGVRLPLTSLFEASTISQQALLLGEAAPQAAGKDTSYLISLHKGKNGTPPLFFVHGFGGGVAGYAHLARKLGANQPFYGLQAGGFDNEQPPHTTIPEMAEAYLSDVRAVQPRGPYYLGGYCYGGLVAFEMARRLQEQGEQVAHLALVESFAPMRRDGRETVFENPRMIIYFFKNLPFWFQDFMQLGWEGMKSRVKVIYRRTKKNLLRKLGKRQPLDARDFIEDDVDLLPERHRELMEIQIRALLQFPRARYNGGAHLYRVRGGSLSQTSDQRYGWEELITGGIEIHFVQGAHRTLLNPPHVESLADEIRQQLGRL
jgi:thioesterase domain-containing protein/acyl carrier protein